MGPPAPSRKPWGTLRRVDEASLSSTFCHRDNRKCLRTKVYDAHRQPWNQYNCNVDEYAPFFDTREEVKLPRRVGGFVPSGEFDGLEIVEDGLVEVLCIAFVE